MSSYEAVLFSEFDVSKLSFSKPKKQSQGSVVSVYYGNTYFVLQTPLMNTFGISEYEGKWSLSLSLNSNNPTSQQEISKFRSCIEELEEKVLNDVSNGLYKDWLAGIGDKWDKWPIEMKREMVSQKMGKKLLRHSKKDLEKKYAPTMNVKLNKKRDSEDFNVSVFMMDEENRIKCNEKGDLIEYDIREYLYFDSEEKKLKPKIFCLFGISIWLINSNIYIVPTCNQVLIEPPRSQMLKVSFNKRGFMKLEEYEMQDGELEQEQLEEDEYMPARA
jgi:hypothetical protein